MKSKFTAFRVLVARVGSRPFDFDGGIEETFFFALFGVYSINLTRFAFDGVFGSDSSAGFLLFGGISKEKRGKEVESRSEKEFMGRGRDC